MTCSFYWFLPFQVTLLLTMAIVACLVTALLLGLEKRQNSKLIKFLLGEHYRLVIAWSCGLLVFAFFYGAIDSPLLIRASPEATLTLSVESAVNGSPKVPNTGTEIGLDQKRSEIKGRIVFRFSHSFIVLTDLTKRSLLVIPEEKVKTVAIPAFRYGRLSRFVK
jgi:hypothetical protein